MVLVAAEGPLWSSGVLRGVFRTTDGGESWSQVLDIDEKTGATDLEFDPSNPEVIYAATYERRQRAWLFWRWTGFRDSYSQRIMGAHGRSLGRVTKGGYG